MSTPSDKEILEAVAAYSGRNMTFVVRNILSLKYRKLKTSQVLRRLKKMEKAGRVQRVSSVYDVQICWEVIKRDEQFSSSKSQDRGSGGALSGGP